MIGKIKTMGLSAGKIILIVFAAICLLLVALGFFRIGLIYWIYSMVEDWIAVRLGFDYYISNLAATAFTAVFCALLPAFAWYLFLGKKQAWGIGTMVGIQLLMCIAIYTVGAGVCFDRRTGKPLCYFADTPAGRVWSFTPGFEPSTGKQFRLYTREIKEAEDRRKPPAAPPPQNRIAPPAPSVRENISNSVPAAAIKKVETARREKSPSPARSTPQTREAVSPLENTQADENFQRGLEMEKIRQAEENRRRQIIERERLEAEQRRSREAENYRIQAEERRRAERERLEAEQERLAREERERQTAREREERQRQRAGEKQRRRRETLKTVIIIAQPIIEGLTRRKN